MEKIENRVKISKENMVTLESPHFIPRMSSFYVYLLHEGSGTNTRAIFHLSLPLLISVSFSFDA